VRGRGRRRVRDNTLMACQSPPVHLRDQHKVQSTLHPTIPLWGALYGWAGNGTRTVGVSAPLWQVSTRRVGLHLHDCT
jgi:hypothetical protein